MKKILISGFSNTLGGIEKFLYIYLKEISNQFDIHLIVFTDCIVYEQELLEMGCKIHRVPSRKESFINFNKAIKELLQKEKFDIVWSNVVSFSSIDLLKNAKSSNVKKIIVHIHNKVLLGSKIGRILHFLNKQRVISIATNFWANSEESWEYAFGTEKKGVVKKIISNPIDVVSLQFSETNKKEIRNELKLTSNDLVIGTISRLSTEKNLEYLMELFFELQKDYSCMKLVIVGDGPEFVNLSNIAKKMGLEKSVIFAGQRNDAYKFYSAFDMYISTSVSEGFGYSAIEAQISGLPLVIDETTFPKGVIVTKKIISININLNVIENKHKVINEINYFSHLNRKEYPELLNIYSSKRLSTLLVDELRGE